jgi:hypothetical protein
MVSSFPFGWIRNIDSENWQLLWNSINKDFFVKATRTKKILILTKLDTWIEAKKFADKVKNCPADYFPEV